MLEAKVSKGEYKKKKKSVVKIPNYSKEESVSDSREETTFDEWEQRQSDKDISEEDDLLLSFRSNVNKEKKKLNRKESIISDPDPDPDLDDDSPFKSPCDRGQTEIEEQPPKRLKRKLKKKKKKRVKSNKKKEKKVEGEKATKRKDFSKFTEVSKKVNKDTMTECYPGQYDNLYTDEKNRAKETKKVSERGSAYEGALRPLLSSIVKDLAEEGFISASYEAIIRHPDIEQLIQVKIRSN